MNIRKCTVQNIFAVLVMELIVVSGCSGDPRSYRIARDTSSWTEESGTGPSHGYREGEGLLELFEPYVFDTGDSLIGSIDYYVYNPTKHGFPQGKKYPVLLCLHGAGNGGINGVRCCGLTDWTVYATDLYQKRLGGAYIVFPKANEYTTQQIIADAAGDHVYQPAGNWMNNSYKAETSIYSDSIYRLAKYFQKIHGTGRLAIIGSSAGGYLAWRLIIDHPDMAVAAIMAAPAYRPSASDIQKIDSCGLSVWIIAGEQDMICPINYFTGPAIPLLEKVESIRLSILDIVRYGDKKVVWYADYPEMGQHLAQFAVGADMIYDDGTSYDSKYNDRITEWLAKRLAE